MAMTQLTHIQQAIEQLSEAELKQFRDWFAELQERQWDEQIARDVQAGRLDALRDEALRDYHQGRTREIT
jgi:hypothetical protein